MRIARSTRLRAAARHMSLAALGTLCVEGVVLGAALVAVHGCGDESDAGSTAPEVPVLAITESVTVSGDAELGYIVGLAVGPDREVYVADQAQSVIVVYPPDGSPPRRIGGHGAGPGEFSRMHSLAWSGDALAVFDPGNGRIEYVGRDGEWVASQPVARASGPDVRLWQAGEDAFYAPAVRPSPEGDGVDLVHVRRGLDVLPDTVYQPRMPPRDEGKVTCDGADGGIHFWRAPSSPRLVRAVTPDGVLASGWSDSLHLVFTRDGSIVDEWQDSVVAEPVPDSAWEAALEEYRGWREGLGEASCRPAGPARPAAVPLLRAVEFDDMGRAWLERVGPDGRWFDVRDREGVPLFRAPAPDRYEAVPFVVRGNRLYYVGEAEDGGQSVVIATFAEVE